MPAESNLWFSEVGHAPKSPTWNTVGKCAGSALKLPLHGISEANPALTPSTKEKTRPFPTGFRDPCAKCAPVHKGLYQPNQLEDALFEHIKKKGKSYP